MSEDILTEKKKRRWYWTWALILFALLLLLGGILWRGQKTHHPKYVIFGDSIQATARGEDSVADRLQVLCGIEFFNASFGGTALAKIPRESGSMEPGDYYSMVSLVNSACARDFSVQQQAKMESSPTSYFAPLIEELDQTSFAKTELMIIAHGMNDYLSGVPLSSDDPMDENTFEGALRYVLSAWKKHYPHSRILLVSPTYAWYLFSGKTCEEQDFGGGFLEQYVESERKIAKEYDVEMIDLYQDLYRHETWEDWEEFTVDGVHPNENGRRMIAERIAAYLEENP